MVTTDSEETAAAGLCSSPTFFNSPSAANQEENVTVSEPRMLGEDKRVAVNMIKETAAFNIRMIRETKETTERNLMTEARCSCCWTSSLNKKLHQLKGDCNMSDFS